MRKTTYNQEWYNKENKMGYLKSDNTQVDYFINSIFSSSVLIETSLKKDICNFSKDELLAYYGSLGSISADSLKNVNSRINRYINWCIVNDLVDDKQNHTTEIDYEDLVKKVNKEANIVSYFTRKQLLGWSNDNKVDEMVVNPRDLAVIWLLFEGVRGINYNEIMEIEFDDFDVKKNTVRLVTGRELKLSKECVDFVLSTKNVDEYVLPTGRRISFIDNKVYRSYRKDQLNRESKSSTTNVNQLKKIVASALSDLGIYNASLKTVIVSGQIEFIKDLANKAGMEVSDYIVLPECYEAIYKRYGVKTWMGKRFYANHEKQFKEEV